MKIEKAAKDKTFLLVLLIGVVFQVSLIFPSGTKTANGIYFWGAHYHDALWHVSLMQKLKNFSFENPVYAGEDLQNYHYLMNLFLGLVSKVFKIPLFLLTYKVFPVLISTATGALTYLFTTRLFNRRSAIWSLFFVMLGSSFAFLLPLFNLGYEVWEMSLWVQQPISTFFNLPYATSLPLILGSFLMLQKYLKTKSKESLIFTALLFCLLPGIKSFSVIFLIVLGIVSVIRFFVHKKTDMILLSSIVFIMSVIVMLPTLNFGDTHLIFEPLWFLQTMMEAPDRVNWQDWILKLNHYRSVRATHHIIRLYIIAFLFFFVGNLGTRIIAILGLPSEKDFFKNEIHLILLISAVVFAAVPLLFLTSGVVWNAIQFFYYFLFIAGIYSGAGMDKLLKKFKNKSLKVVFALVVVLITIPVNIHTLVFYYGKPPGYKISGEQYQVLQDMSLTGSHNEVVLTLPADSSFIFVPAISGKSTYLGDELMAIVPGHDFSKRYNQIKEALKDQRSFRNFLVEESIEWVYSLKTLEPFLAESKTLVKYYDGKDFDVYKVNNE